MPRPERVPADETQQFGLGIRAAGHLDPGAVLAGGAENLLHLLHPAEELSAEAGVQPVVLAAIGIHQRTGISFWDAMIVRSAAETGCAVLYSEDLNDGQEYSGVRVENPFQPPDADRA